MKNNYQILGDRKTLHKLRAVLFDMNGVLVDDEKLHQAAFAKLLQEFGLKLTRNDYQRYFAGRTDKEGVRNYQKAVGHEHELQRIIKKKPKVYQELVLTKGLKSYPGALEFVEGAITEGLPLALVTSAIRPEATAVLHAYNLNEKFKVVLTAEDIAHSKPDPEGYLRAAHDLGIEPNECLVIEDSPSGVEAAHAAGMSCLAVTHTHARKELKDADFIVRRLNFRTLKEISEETSKFSSV